MSGNAALVILVALVLYYNYAVGLRRYSEAETIVQFMIDSGRDVSDEDREEIIDRLVEIIKIREQLTDEQAEEVYAALRRNAERAGWDVAKNATP